MGDAYHGPQFIAGAGPRRTSHPPEPSQRTRQPPVKTWLQSTAIALAYDARLRRTNRDFAEQLDLAIAVTQHLGNDKRPPTRVTPRRTRHQRHCPATAAPLNSQLRASPARRRAVPGGAAPGRARGRGGGNKGSSRPSRGSGAVRRAHTVRWRDSLGDRHPVPSRRRALQVTSGRQPSALSSARSVASYSAQGSNPV